MLLPCGSEGEYVVNTAGFASFPKVVWMGEEGWGVWLRRCWMGERSLGDCCC